MYPEAKYYNLKKNGDNPVIFQFYDTKNPIPDLSGNAAYIDIVSAEDPATIIDSYSTVAGTLTATYSSPKNVGTFVVTRAQMADYTIGKLYYGDYKVINDSSQEIFYGRIWFQVVQTSTSSPT